VSYTGKLLIARPGIEHSLFAESVIYVCQDLPTGATGLILNKPLDDLKVSNICDIGDMTYLNHEPLYQGGPIKASSVTMLHTKGWWSANTIDVGEYISLSSDEFMLDKLSINNSPDEWRMFAGICMWTPGQLEAEIDGTGSYTSSGNWIILEPKLEDIFVDNFESHWEKAVEMYSSQLVNTYF